MKPDKIVHRFGSSFLFDKNSDKYAYQFLKEFKHYASEGYTLLLDNLDIIYGALYDMFNQRFSSHKGKKYCSVTFEDFKETIVVQPDFNCFILKEEAQLQAKDSEIERKLPSPLMNRFEKHIFRLENLPGMGKIILLIKTSGHSILLTLCKEISSIFSIFFYGEIKEIVN